VIWLETLGISPVAYSLSVLDASRDIVQRTIMISDDIPQAAERIPVLNQTLWMRLQLIRQ